MMGVLLEERRSNFGCKIVIITLLSFKYNFLNTRRSNFEAVNAHLGLFLKVSNVHGVMPLYIYNKKEL